jgi:hypothetical protein
MKTEFLTGLGLTKEQIDAVMAENGKDINAEKSKTQALQEQMTGLQEKLKAFDGVDVGELKAQVKKLSEDMAAQEAAHAKRVAEIEFNSALEAAVLGAKPRNKKAVLALLDTEKLMESKNQSADIAAALEAVRKENEYLFEAESRRGGSTPGISTQAGGADEKGAGSPANQAMRVLFGKQE